MTDVPAGDTYHVPATEPGARLDRLIAGALPQFSRSLINVLIRFAAFSETVIGGGGGLAFIFEVASKLACGAQVSM